MHLFMTASVEVDKVFNFLAAPLTQRSLMMQVEGLAIQEVFTTAGAFPMLCPGHQIVL